MKHTLYNVASFVPLGSLNGATGPGALKVFSEFLRGTLPGIPGGYCLNATLCTGIYGTPFKPDVLLKAKDWPTPVAMLCSNQNEPGSTYQKVGSDVLSITRNAPLNCPWVFLITGDEWPEGVFDFLAQEVATPGSKIAKVWRKIDDLRNWFVRGGDYHRVVSTERTLANASY